MKRALALVVLLAAAPAPAQYVILGVLETGDFTIAVDTNTFFWGLTLPDAKFVPADWGGSPGTTDTFRFEVLIPTFPPNVWIDYHRGGTIMARETILGMVPDSFYNLPRFDKAPTRVKFLRQPGIEEGRHLAAHGLRLTASPNPFRSSTVLHLTTGPQDHSTTFLRIYDASGRLVRSLPIPRSLAPDPYSLSWDGRDAAGREVAPGVYLCRVRARASAPPLRLVKLD